tara:strand:- start:1172 stop:1942 length:771 start_codon:yes stop_codon:yes gene_type:complete
MTDDLASAYSSIYDKKEEGKEQLDELGPLAAIPLAMKAVKVAGAVKTGIDAVKNIMPKKQKERGGTANNLEHVEIEHLDGGTTEIVDVVKPEPLGNPDENLADRLWDQVASNLTTLGEMSGVRYRVSPVEPLEEKKAKKDYDGDGQVESGAKEYRGVIHNKIQQKKGMKGDGKDTSSIKEAKNGGDNDPCWDSHKQVGMKKKGGKMVPNCVPKESFSVKSPVVFSKPVEKTEDEISEEMVEKHASSISKAHRSIQK